MHIAIIGCGQLARMLALSGWSMGIRFSFLADEHEDARCVEGLGIVVRQQQGDSPEDVFVALGKPDIITIEKEAVDGGLLQALNAHCQVFPRPQNVHLIQHRARQKEFLRDNAIPTAPFLHISDKQQLLAAAEHLGLPLVLKSCQNGYDGQQQWHLHDANELHSFIDGPEQISDAIAEKKLSFTQEVSLILARNEQGQMVTYSPTENSHSNGTLTLSIAPARLLSKQHVQQLNDIATAITHALDYVGVLAIECFVLNEQIVVNELAPRVHNSGHWTQDGAASSQFENHLRAISGRALGSTENLGHTAMLNLLGCEPPKALTSHPHAHLHWYNKTLKTGRKMGHVNLLYQNFSQLESDLLGLQT